MRSLAGVPETWWLLKLPSPLPLSSPDARSLAVPARGALPGNVGRNDHTCAKAPVIASTA